MSSTPIDLSGPWTFDRLAELPDDGRRYEVVDGHLVVTPGPSQDHQTACIRLYEELGAVMPDGWEILIECPLPLGTDGRIPDLAVIRGRRVLTFRGAPYPIPPRDFGLVVEVSSPSTRKTDLFAKPGEYAEAGIPLFWRLDTEPDLALHAFTLDGTSYVEATVVRERGDVPTPWGLVTIDLERIRTGRR